MEESMKTEMKMIYWKSGKFWLGKLKEHPEIMTQGKTLKELEEKIAKIAAEPVTQKQQNREKDV